MNIFEYYMYLISKPEIMLSSAEQFFRDCFIPAIAILFFLVVIVCDFIISKIIDFMKRRKK